MTIALFRRVVQRTRREAIFLRETSWATLGRVPMLIWVKYGSTRGLKSTLTCLGGSEVVKFFSPERKVVLGRDARSRLGLNFDGIGDMDRTCIGFDRYRYYWVFVSGRFFSRAHSGPPGGHVIDATRRIHAHDVHCKIPGQELTQLYLIKRKVRSGRFFGVPKVSSKPTSSEESSDHSSLHKSASNVFSSQILEGYGFGMNLRVETSRVWDLSYHVYSGATFPFKE